MEFLVKLNRDLYKDTVAAIKKACKHFGINSDVNIHVYSANANPKMPAKDLHQALSGGGARLVETDKRIFKFKSGNNIGTKRASFKSNMHVARL